MKTIKSEQGQSLVELSVSLVLLLLLLAGAVEFGIAFFQFVQLRDAAQEGALYGSMKPTDYTNIEERVRNASYSPIDLSRGTGDVSVYVDGTEVWKNGSNVGVTSSACEGHGLMVEITFQHHIFMPFIPQILGNTDIPIKASVTDTILSPTCP